MATEGRQQFYEIHFQNSMRELAQKAGGNSSIRWFTLGKRALAGMNVANLIDLTPVDSKETPDWNAGFWAGFKDELSQSSPAVRK